MLLLSLFLCIMCTYALKSAVSPVTLGISAKPPSGAQRAIIAHQKKPLKLPVWPIWGGVLAQLADWAGANKLSNDILNTVGGRVIPISLTDLKVSPFILLVHHRHSFTSFDPFRSLTKLLLPEGFPAHPHAGFDTLTYCLQGGLKHRDSEGVAMSYGVRRSMISTVGDEANRDQAEIQWMRSGRGVIHEEMWDIPTDKVLYHHPIELFQLWINLPFEYKSSHPSTKLLYSSQMPVYATSRMSIKVIAGKLTADDTGEELVGEVGNSLAGSPLGIYHINLSPDRSAESTFNMHLSHFDQVVLYVRTGNGKVGEKAVRAGDLFVLRPPSGTSHLPPCAFSLTTAESGLDCLMLVGQELGEEGVSAGAFVLPNIASLEKYQRIFGQIAQAGGFWSAKLSDDQWITHVKKLNLQELTNFDGNES